MTFGRSQLTLPVLFCATTVICCFIAAVGTDWWVLGTFVAMAFVVVFCVSGNVLTGIPACVGLGIGGVVSWFVIMLADLDGSQLMEVVHIGECLAFIGASLGAVVGSLIFKCWTHAAVGGFVNLICWVAWLNSLY